MSNRHGCKWLDETRRGCGYCSMILRSKHYKTWEDKVRREDKGRCELYEAGDFKTRFEGMEATE